MGYEQHMKHWKNHRKDRFFQQCSGPVHELETAKTREQEEDSERSSFLRLMEKIGDDQFPVFVRQISGGIWTTTSERDCFGHRIENRDELLRFYELYV